MSETRQARPADYEPMIRHLENTFGLSWGGFVPTWPTEYRRERFDFENTLLVVEEGKILSLLKVFHLDLVLGGLPVRVGGIGAVSTAPEARGRGFMSRLMEAADESLRREGLPVSILGGDRQRYLRFGYENAGRVRRLLVTRRGLGARGVKARIPDRWQGEQETLEAVAAAYDLNDYRRQRAPADYPVIFQGRGCLLMTAGRGDDFGYLSLAGFQGRDGLEEFGGRPETVLAIAAFCLESFDLPGITFFFPGRESIPGPYLAACDREWVDSALMLKVLDEAETVRLFAGQAGAGPAPGPAELAALDGPGRTRALFGTLEAGAPFNVFLWPSDII